MTKRQTTSTLNRLAIVLVAGTAFIATAGIAHAKGDHHHHDDRMGNSSNFSSNSIRESNKNDGHKADKHWNKESKRDRKDKEANGCRKHCMEMQHKREKEAKRKESDPVTITNGVVSEKIRVRPGETLGFGAEKGIITVTEFGRPGGLHKISFGGSVTLSSSVADALRLSGGNGKAGNIGTDGTVSFKQNPDGSLTVTANPPPLKGL